jgi:trans-2,3-dihydro-3-hydroxyanthranilate isomerase
MPATLPMFLVDAFAGRSFRGNSAGVIPAADGLSDAQMQAIAREINASETAFIFDSNDLHQPPFVRWFTPTVEVGFCGHATLAAAHALADLAARDAPAIEFRSKAGPLKLTREKIPTGGALWWLEMPDPGLRPDNTNPMRSCELLGLQLDDLDPAAPWMRTRDDDVLVLVKSWNTLTGLRPNMLDLAAWSERHRIRGWCIATRQTLSDAVHVCSRFFAPAAGVPEDPVTGSVHGPLAAHLASCGLIAMDNDRAALNCIQGQPGGRTGTVHALVTRRDKTWKVLIGGGCHTTIRGEIVVPAE